MPGKGAAGGRQAGNGVQAESFQQNLQNKSVGRGEPLLETFLINHVESSHEQEIYPTTSLDENCIEFEIQGERNYCVDLRQTYLALKLNLVRGRGYETYNTKEVKQEHKEEGKAEEEETAEEDDPVPLVTHVNNILHSIFSNVEVYINNQQIYNSNGLYAHKSYISHLTISREPSLNTRKFCTARVRL